jgi:hypothetical protein
MDFSDIPEASDEQLREMRRVGRPPLGGATATDDEDCRLPTVTEDCRLKTKGPIPLVKRASGELSRAAVVHPSW